MFNKQKLFSTPVAPLLIGLGVVGVAMGAGQANPSDAPVRCEILATSASGMMTLEGVVHADVAASGSYRFRVSSSGRSGGSNIEQGGSFRAGPNDAVTLGRVVLGGVGAIYDASLKVTSNGTTVECAERVGGAI